MTETTRTLAEVSAEIDAAQAKYDAEYEKLNDLRPTQNTASTTEESAQQA